MIKIKYSKKSSEKQKKRLKNKARIRKKVFGTAERPRMAVYRSGKHTYAQLIDDSVGKTLVSASTLKVESGSGKNVNAARLVGAELAKKALEKEIKNVVFDRSGYVYHGRVKALAESARESGLSF